MTLEKFKVAKSQIPHLQKRDNNNWINAPGMEKPSWYHFMQEAPTFKTFC